MDFLDKAKLEIREAKRDKKIFLYTVIILIPCVGVMLFAFLAAFLPVDFKISANGDYVSVVKIGYFCSYAPANLTPSVSDFSWGWLNNLMICCCVGVSIFMIAVIYLNFFVARKTILNRYAYVICGLIVIGIILDNVYGQLAGKNAPNEEVTGINFFPTFFSSVKIDGGTNIFLYRWNEAGIVMLVLQVVLLSTMVMMFPFWIVVGVKTGRLAKDTGKKMMMQDDHTKALIAKQIVLEKKAYEA